MKILVCKDFTANGKSYIVGDEIKDLSYQQIVKLNEKGYIEPLTYKDLVLIKRELEEKNLHKEEVL